jgi:hypothetical protein
MDDAAQVVSHNEKKLCSLDILVRAAPSRSANSPLDAIYRFRIGEGYLNF